MENKKLVYNNEQYNILTNINIGTTTFLICIDIFDKKLQYFKQEVLNGKIKLTSQTNLINTASSVNQKSISNKKRILDAFILKMHEKLASCVFVDRIKVANLFKDFSKEIDNCDLKYYIIDNASIEPKDESISNLVSKFNDADITKALDNVKQIQNELYYYNTSQEEPKKEQEVSNQNRITAVNQEQKEANDALPSGPIMAADPFKDLENKIDNNNDVPLNNNLDLSQTQVIADILNSTNISTNIDVPSSNGIEQLVNNDIPITQTKTSEPEKKESYSHPVQSDNKKLYITIFLVTLIVAAGGFFLLFNKGKGAESNKDILNQLLKTTTIADSDNGEVFNEPDQKYQNYSTYMDMKLLNVDFEELIETNSDTKAWINIPSLNINYPVVQASKNSFYTNHNYYKKQSNDGWIHADSTANFKEFGYNTIIYGSNAKDGSLFANLKRTINGDWNKDYKNFVIKLSTPNSNTLWQIFSTYEVKIEDYYLTTDFADEEEYMQFLEEMQSRSSFDYNASLNQYDKILTLSTDKDKNTRIVVQAKLIKIEEKK